MTTSFHALALAFAFALPWAGSLQAQACNGLPFRGQTAIAATYLTGDAPDTPFGLRQYGASVLRQLPGWSVMGTHHAVRLDGVAARASFDTPRTAPTQIHLDGRQLGAGASYTMDALPGSVAGPYAICFSAALQGVAWRMAGQSGRGLTAPFWLSFGVPFRAGSFGAFPHASFGGYVREVSGGAPEGDIRSRGVRPFGDSGVGIIVGPLRVDASVRHEFRTRSRGIITVGLDP